MDHQIKHSPGFSILEIAMSAGDSVTAQPDSMLAMTGGIGLAASIGRNGSGWTGGFKSMLGGENFFTTQYTAKKDDQLLTLAPEAYGDILELPLPEVGSFYLTRGSYLANVGSCDLQIKYSGVKGLMSRKGLFLLRATGEGTVFCQSYGALIERDLTDGENFYVDNRFVVAFADTVEYQLVKATESVKDSLMSGEGLVNRYTGPGKIYYQTRGKPSAGFLGRMFELAF